VKFNFRDRDIEVRASKNFFGKLQPEVVKWVCMDEDGEERCFTLLWWVYDKETKDWDIQFVSRRPFEEFKNTIPESIWKAMRYMDELLKGVSND